MLARLKQSLHPLDEIELARHDHALVLVSLPDSLRALPALPHRARLLAVLRRRRMKLDDFSKAGVTLQLDHGGLCAYVAIDRSKPRFEQQSLLRKALTSILEEQPRGIAIGLFGDDAFRSALAREALYVAWVNGVPLPARKKKDDARALASIHLHGVRGNFDDVAVVARANVLARQLTALPPNELTPGVYRQRLKKLAREQGWQHEEFDCARLGKIGAGAFLAVAQGSPENDAAIVHLSSAPRGARHKVALVGKGICFDTGGHNLKSAKYMAGMHEDMNGSAVALGVFQALAEAGAQIQLDLWLAIAQNHLSPQAYKQNDVVKALDGTTIEVVHTDAEGRMVLADTLVLASRGDPNLIVDFATLTGSMHYALGSRYSGVFASDDALGLLAVSAGRSSGERMCLFPHDADYDAALDSRVADVRQCILDGEADHILAARFLKRFTAAKPWLHVDLSAHNCPGGLGAVGSDITGFGVAWGVELLKQWLAGRLGGKA